MLKPNKYTNLNLSVIGLSSLIIKLLKNDPSQKYSQILGKIIYKEGKSAKENFLLALCFLFALGKIRYYKDQDVLELLI